MTVTQDVSFIQSATPPLRDGRYTLSATQTVPGQTPAEYPATATFVVSGERFTLSPPRSTPSSHRTWRPARSTGCSPTSCSTAARSRGSG